MTPADAVLTDALREAGCTDEEVRVMLVARAVAWDAARVARAGRRLALRDPNTRLTAPTVLDDIELVTEFARKFLP